MPTCMALTAPGVQAMEVSGSVAYRSP
jgi:hypothetical protein